MARKNPDKNLKSATAATEGWFQFGKYRLDLQTNVVFRGGRRLRLTPKAVDTLRVLIERAGAIVSIQTLMAEVWPGTFVEEGSITRNVSDLRRALGGRRHIETVPKRGYRFVAAVRHVRPPHTRPLWMVAVRPFVPASGDGSLDKAGLSLATALVTKLGAVRGCAAYVLPSEGQRRPRRATDVQAPELTVRGTIQQRDDAIRLTAEFVGGRSNSSLWTETLEHHVGESGSLEDAIGEELAGAVALWFSKRHRKLLAKRYTKNARAYQSYLSGHFHASKRSEAGLERAIESFRRAVEIDSEYALGYAGLAASYALLPMLAVRRVAAYMPKARTAALNALEVDETLAEARAALAFVKWHYDWDWSGAEREFRRILTFHARDVLARQWLGLLLAEQGRFTEAIEQATRAQCLDRNSPSTRANLATVLLFAGRNERAEEEARQVLIHEPASPRAHLVLGIALERRAEFEAAIVQLRNGLQGSPQIPILLGSLGYTLGASGRRDEAMNMLITIERLPPASGGAYAKALTFIGLGDTSSALDALENARLERDFAIVLLKVDRRLDGLRTQLRFREIVSGVGLSEA